MDPEFAELTVNKCKERGLHARTVSYYGFPIDTGTIVALKLLNPDNRIPAIVVSSNMYANRAETIVLGKAARDAIKYQKKKAVVVVVSSLSNRMFTEHINPSEDRIHSAKDDEWNKKILEFFDAGRLEDISQLSRDIHNQIRVSKVVAYKPAWWLAATMGQHNNYEGEVLYFTLEGNLTFAYTAGKPINDSQPTIIFIHGAANDHSVWTQQTRYFANHQWNALAIDLPGHGRSEGSPLDQISQMSSWVTRLISELNVPKAVVVGHSMGSLVALDLSARFSDITSGLVMIGTTFPMQVSDSLLKYSAKNDPRAYELINRFSIAEWQSSNFLLRESLPDKKSFLILLSALFNIEASIPVSSFIASNSSVCAMDASTSNVNISLSRCMSSPLKKVSTF